MGVDLINDSNDDEAKKKAASAQPGAVQDPGANASAPPNSGAGGASGNGTIQASNQRKTGSGFNNIQNVLNANKQNQLGSTIGSGIQNLAGNVRQNLGSSQQEFQQNVDKNALNTKDNQDYVNNTINNATGVNTTGQGPNVQQQDVDKFANLRSGSYAGPTTLRNQVELNQQAQRVQSLGQNVGSAGGNQALLQQFVGNGRNYSRGQQTLDALLLGKTGAQPLQQARQSTFGLNNLVNESGNTAAQIAQMQAGYNKQFGQDLTNKLGQGATPGIDGATGTTSGGLIGGMIDEANAGVTKGNATATAEFNAFQKRFHDKQLNQDDVEKIRALTGGDTTLGLSPDDLSQAFSQGIYTKEGVLGTKKAAQLQALQKLAGREDMKLDPSKITDKPIKNVNEDLSKFGDQRQKYLDNKANFDKYQNLIGATNYNSGQMSNGISDLQKRIDEINNVKGNPMLGQDAGQQHAKLAEMFRSAAQNPYFANNPNILRELKSFENQSNSFGVNSGDVTKRLNPYIDSNKQMSTALQQMLDSSKESVGLKDSQSLSSLMNPEAQKLYNQQYNSAPQNLKMDNTLYNQQIKDLIKQGEGNPSAPGMGALTQIGNGLYGLGGSVLGGISSLFSDKNLKKNIKSGDKPVENFLDMIKPHQYDYKNPEHGEGKQLSVMAQDLEKSPEGKQAVEDSPEGKKVNYGKLAAMMLASQANIHDRLKKLESKKK